MKCNDYRMYGDFNSDGSEFVITRQDTPKLWNNYAWNRNIVVRIDQRGRGDTYYRDSAGREVCLINDRTVFIKDRNTGDFWTHGWTPVKLDLNHFTCHHGLGYTRLESEHQGIHALTTITSANSDPVEIWQILVRNTDRRQRQLSVYPFVAFDLSGSGTYGGIENYIRSEQSANTIYAFNLEQHEHIINSNAFIACDGTIACFETSRRNFLGGIYGQLESPAGLRQDKLSSASTANEDMVGVFQHDLTLEPDQHAVINIIVGSFNEKEQVDRLKKQYLVPGSFEKAFASRQSRLAFFSNVDLHLSDDYLDKFLNIWTKQNLSFLMDYSRRFGMGFRDTLQDAQAFCSLDPERAKLAIVMACKHQYADGSCLRCYWPLDKMVFSDSGAWLAYTLDEYVRETGDLSILDQIVPYYDNGQATIFEHLNNALDWIYAQPGEHGLAKLCDGDWNDALSMGVKGRGESLWLSIALLWSYELSIGLARRIGRTDAADNFAEKMAKLRRSIDKHGWDGQWYIRGFDDLGQKVGSKDCQQGKIFSICQTWAIMSGLAKGKEDTLEKALQQHLMTDYGLLTSSPGYTRYIESIGRITTWPPGWGTNACAYCHVGAFKAVADCIRRDPDAALDIISRLLPNNPRIPIDVSAAEPYVYTNMYLGPEHPRAGVSLRGWFTGTCGWVFRCVTQYMLGVRPDFDGLRIEPVLPTAWPNVRMKRKFRTAQYHITINNPQHITDGRAVITIDGQEIQGSLIPFEKYNGSHIVNVTIVAP